MDIQKIFEQAKTFQAKMAEMEKEMADWQETGQAGEGAVMITLDGNFNMVNMTIEDRLLTKDNKSNLIDLIKTASCDATSKMKNRIEEEQQKFMGSLSISNLPI